MGILKQLEPKKDKKDKKEKKLSLGANLKLIFLVLAVGFGVFLDVLRSNNHSLAKKIPVTIPRPSPVNVNLDPRLVDDVQKSANSVLGDATNIVQTKIDQTKEDVTDSVLKNSTVAFIESVIGKLPIKQQKEVKEALCK